MRKLVICLAATFSVAAAACKKSHVSSLRIEDFQDGSPKDSVIQLWGHGFSQTPAGNEVRFAGGPGTVTSVDGDTTLYVKVPALALTGPITVTAHGETAKTPEDFKYTYTVSTLAGTGKNGSVDASGTAASFYMPSGIATDAAGNIFVADTKNASIRMVSPTGAVMRYDRDKSFVLRTPADVVCGKNGDVYVADPGLDKIMKVDINGKVTVFAGHDTSGYMNGKGTDAVFDGPAGICMDQHGNLYVADSYNYRIRKITPDGTVTTIAGTGASGHADGAGSSAQFRFPKDVCVAKDGTLYVADGDYTIRKISPLGIVSTVAGKAGERGYVDGTADVSRLGSLSSISIDDNGLVWFTELDNCFVKTLDGNGAVKRFSGDGINGYMDGLQFKAWFSQPAGLAKGADGTIYVCDQFSPRIRKIN